ncbi:EamA family transporter [Orbus mooreae]|uniref:EamA family transporter n=1 Tax=Orbus mooreae TaxID=3074107 RepID=UPI00370DADE5
MSLLAIILWLSNIAFDTLGQVAFKYAAVSKKESDGVEYWKALFSNGWLWLGITAYVAEFLLWLAFLTLVPLFQGVLMVSLNIITVMIVGRLLFGEKLTNLRLIGMFFILIGVILVGAS